MVSGMRRPRAAAFTLIELIVVMLVVSLLLTLAAPRYFVSLERARETALQQTLSVTREALDKYYGDNGRYPESLEALVFARYLRSLPLDPVTGSSGTWTVVPPPDPDKGRVYDLHSGAEGVSRNGKPYREM